MTPFALMTICWLFATFSAMGMWIAWDYSEASLLQKIENLEAENAMLKVNQ